MTVGENVEYGLRVAQGRQGRARAGARAEALEMVRLAGYERPQAERALRRPAPAGRARPRDRQPAAGAAARRAARRPRPEAARADAGRAEGDPGRGRDHVRLRHPRPGGGADDVATGSRSSTRAGSSRSATPGGDLRAPGNAVRGRLRRRLERARARRAAVHGPARRRSGCSSHGERRDGLHDRAGHDRATSPTRG